MTNRSDERERPAGRPRAGGRPQRSFGDLRSATPVSRAMTLTDLAGWVAGFAAAAGIYRGTVLALVESAPIISSIVSFFGLCWLGTVMAGPIVLGARRLRHGRQFRLAAGERIWCLLGAAWMLVALARALRGWDAPVMTSIAACTALAAAALAPVLLVGLCYSERRRAFVMCSRVSAKPAPGLGETQLHPARGGQGDSDSKRVHDPVAGSVPGVGADRAAGSWSERVGVVCAAAWPAGWMLAGFLLGL